MTLDELMDEAERFGKALATEGEILGPHILFDTARGTTKSVHLTRPDFMKNKVHAAMQLLLHGATCAVLVMEAYVTDRAVKDPLNRLVGEGALRVSDLPPDQRRDALWLLGEDLLKNQRTRGFFIERTHGLTTFAPQFRDDKVATSEGATMSRWFPLFAQNAASGLGVGHIPWDEVRREMQQS